MVFFDENNQHICKDCENTLNKEYFNINHKWCERTTDIFLLLPKYE